MSLCNWLVSMDLERCADAFEATEEDDDRADWVEQLKDLKASAS